MRTLLPSQSDARPEPGEGIRIVGLGEETTDGVFEALSSGTTRAVLAAVYDEPGTNTEVADRVDTSLQNAKYHLDKLREADLVEVADTWYSEQGNEMKVYAPTNRSVVMVAGDEGRTTRLRETLARLVGSVGVLLVAGFVVERVVRPPGSVRFLGEQASDSTTGIPALELGGWLTPGVLFVAGGLFVLLALLAWSYFE